MRTLCLLALLLSLATPTSAAVAVTYVATTEDTTDSATHSFTDAAIGTASADRCVDVFLHTGRSFASAITIKSATIGGNAASILRQEEADNGSITRYVGAITLLVTSGTTATIATEMSVSVNRMVITVLTRTGTGGDCTTLSDSDFSEAEDPSVTLDIPAGGAAIGGCTDINTSTTWVGITEVNDTTSEVMQATAAELEFATVQSGLTLTCNFVSGADSAEIGIFLSFAPGGVPARIIGGGVF